ncbi:AVAST type 1 anti-phage system protein Avs1c [Pseudoalteromonas sp. NGC95]|uniref:AVAST type 1 anti-phage system protein Avs1c n=1 Tax=Pseudoalteromonas sp. NGC95 TaxID=2792051 RepID=UPI0018CE9893|nr:AVAST type 1 anti-phage system protein Avs1c [Pseudoalteromonas sp. NGC95]MBH0018716.1 hypothetical protein [Pseudoalteromonas sp. NGC95]
MTRMVNTKAPRNRLEFERNFDLLAEKMHQGKMHFSQDVTHSVISLKKVRKLPNKRIDLLTIDESSRNLANMMNNFPDIANIVPPKDTIK